MVTRTIYATAYSDGVYRQPIRGPRRHSCRLDQLLAVTLTRVRFASRIRNIAPSPTPLKLHKSGPSPSAECHGLYTLHARGSHPHPSCGGRFPAMPYKHQLNTPLPHPHLTQRCRNTQPHPPHQLLTHSPFHHHIPPLAAPSRTVRPTTKLPHLTSPRPDPPPPPPPSRPCTPPAAGRAPPLSAACGTARR